MPSHLICDAHEWSNVILTVPICDSAKPLPRERAWGWQRGNESQCAWLHSDSANWLNWCRICGRGNSIVKYHNFWR